MAIDLDVHGNTKPLEAAVQAAINRIRRQPIKITVDDKGATQPLGNMRRAADEFSKSMEAANARILAFGASMAIINGVADAFKGMVRNLVEVEKSLADINVVMGLSTQNLDKFGDGLFKVAKETGAAFRVAADAATEYARQGLSMEESLKRTRDALVLTRLTGMDSAEAVKSLTAAMNTYGNQIKDTTQLVSKFAAVDVQFAVSAEDFAAAISRTGQSAKSAGVDINELIGIVTSAQQQTARGGAVIGNALKSIFTKIGKPEALNQLENLGVAVRDAGGNMLGAKKILMDLAGTFDTLSEAQQSQISQTIAGLFHVNIFKAVLKDAAKQNSILANATQISASATDEAIQKNEQLRNTMSAMAGETGNALKQLSVQVGELMLAPGMEKILNTVKSLAEGASEILGDGEGAGSRFANGFLKGLGNVITGPGLVIITTVFVKLFMTAAKFTKESLSSLIGVTSEAQKQKAIQTSLVALIGQNAALGKEMLRTDISRTEKEKILLGLLRMQTAEAENLNRVSKQLASTLYTKGYGPGLTTGKRRAYGHIPNYADPERSQAARGGYAAGSIRSMNMPGEGSVIYNSAETVKNFAGFKQPAIMPPQSSKAGKNYQQAFGNIHGFDPYAAGGYVPNFVGPRTHINQGSAKYIGLSATNSADRMGTLYATAGTGASNVFSNAGRSYREAATKSKGAKIDYEFYSLDESEKRKYYDTKVEDELKEGLQEASFGIMNQLLQTLSSKDQNFIAKKADLSKDLPENKMSVVAGHIFEAAAKTILRTIGAEAAIPDSETARIDFLRNNDLYDLFGVKGSKGSVGAEAKINSNEANAKSFARKIYDLEIGGKGITSVSKTSALLKTKADRDKFESWVVQNKGQIINGVTIGKSGNARYSMLRDKNKKERLLESYASSFKSKGFIPNFADPLSDAIGREKAAGVPVSQIRVGSHGALMSKGNPLGLGVTNTHDEPNGLRDVFGANGFVPNYAFQQSDFNPRDASGQFRSTAKLVDQANKNLHGLIDAFKKGKISHEQLIKGSNNLSQKYQLSASAHLNMSNSLNSMQGPMDKLKSGLSSTKSGFGAFSKKFSEGKVGKALQGNAAQMGLMLGLPMAAGFVKGDDPTNRMRSSLGGTMEGVGTGASMGMMFGPLGMAVGGVVGGFMGLIKGLDGANKAIEENRKANLEYAGSAGRQMGAALTNIPEVMNALTKFQPKFQDLVTKEQAMRSSATTYSKENVVGSGWGYLAGPQIVKSVDKGKIQEADKMQREAAGSVMEQFTSALSSLPEDYVFQAQEILTESQRKAGKTAETKGFTGAEYLKEIEKLGGGEKLIQAYKEFTNSVKKSNQELEKQRKGIIKQLNMQSVMIASQKAAADAQFDIKKKYIEMSSTLDRQEKLMGHLMTEEHKAKLKYRQSILKAQEAYDAAESQAQQDLKSGILQQIQSGGDKDVLQSALKTLDRFKGVSDISPILGKMSPKELIDVLEEVKSQHNENKSLQDAVNKLIQNRLDLMTNQIDKAKQTQELSDLTSQKEKETNLLVAKRVESLKSMNIQMTEYVRQLEHAAEIGRIEQDIARTKFGAPGMGYGAGTYRTEAEKIAFERDLLSKRPSTLAGSQTQMAQKTISELQMEGISPKSFVDTEGKFDIESLKTGLEEELNKQLQPGQSKIDLLKASVEARKGDIQEYIKKSDPRKFPSIPQEERMQNSGVAKSLMLEQQVELEKLNELERLQTEQKEKNQEKITDTISALKDAEEKESKITEQLKTQLDVRERLLKYKRGEALPGDDKSAMRRGIGEGMDAIREKVQYMDYELGEKIPGAFADGLANAMSEGLSGAKDIGEALRDAGISFLQMIQKAMMQKAASSIVGALPFSRGGNVRKYSQGGGVPAMVSNGEYVMSREAVNKYGGSFMHGLNAGGSVRGYSNGGKLADKLVNVRREKVHVPGGAQAGSALASGFGGGEGYISGRKYQSKAMSGHFYSQSGNVGLGEDAIKMSEIIQERNEKQEKEYQDAMEKHQKKMQLVQTAVGIAMSAGISWGVGKFGPKDPFSDTSLSLEEAAMKSDAMKNPGNYSIDQLDKMGLNTRWRKTLDYASSAGSKVRSLFGFKNKTYGGPIRKYASGGHISGKSGIDQIPAMLSEGEYVIRASSARQLGKPMLDRINAGKFNQGGAVSELMGSSEIAASGGNTNNINISINMERGSGSKKENQSQDSSGQNPADRSNEEQNSSALAERIKQQVVSVIVEEQRPGGLLSD